MIKADIIVVGAGPGGVTAAQRLAKKGVQVVLLEKNKMPWLKTCGDLVTREGLEALGRSGLGAWTEQFKLVDRLRFTSPVGQVLDVFLGEKPVARMIPRFQMDALLVKEAVRCGVNFMEGTRVSSVEIDEIGVQVSADGVQAAAQMVILADGSHAPITRSLGLFKEQVDLIAVRQYLTGDSDPDGPLEFHFQEQIIPGYTWMFPIGNGQVNVGAGTYFRRTRSKEVDLRAWLEQFKAQHPIQADRLAKMEPVGPMRGHPLHTHLGGTQTHAERVLVVGDAAGLVGPFTGEGIAAALRSGERAADMAWDALQAGDFSAERLAPYTRSLEERYKADQRAARILRASLKTPALLNRFIGNLCQDEEMARTFGLVYVDELPPRFLLRPGNVLRAVG
ncbi:MAG: NAD(P)/FAD-dependent oxidoreductase [Anaerolineaceae bacterium]|nr:NAD(P)/FAD-dependent oxidoreductase [Anaerolineaceae bacterium]